MKKIISVLLSTVLILNTFFMLPVGNINAQADTNTSYANQLRNLGFPESYIDDLVKLHEKYPNWIFKPFKTGLSWSEAVNGERTPHSKQTIQKYSGNDNKSYYCTCSSCYKNGNYVVQEKPNWVSASKTAVEYYMDPRNFLNEQEIFQFESTAYDGAQTTAGVEAILKGTWMYNSTISYKDSNGKTKTINKKYSQAIVEAANASGMSAYYLASKIKQEVGGSSPTAGGASGTVSGYKGIYNYYNIYAYTGANDGLKWAATSGYYTNCACKVRQSYTTNSKELVTLPANTSVTVKSETSKQSDNHTWYQVSVVYGGKTYNGYIRSDLVDKDTYGRPWTDPYTSIYYGAKWIKNNFGGQNTGYLQKFNVNSATGQLYSHEYMANVQGAAAEAKSTYNAYKSANILGMTKTFSIPVFNGMPYENSYVTVGQVNGLKVTAYTSNSVSLSWNKLSSADGYKVQVFRSGGWTDYATTSGNSIKITGLITCGAYIFRVAAYEKYNSKNYFGPYSSEVYQVTRAKGISNFKVASKDSDSVTLTWKAEPRVTGYRIYKYNSSTKTFNYYKTVKAGTTTFTDKGLNPGTTYQYEIIGYRDYRNKMYFGYSTNSVSAKTTGLAAPTVKITGYTSNSVSLSWNKIYNADSYKVMVFRSGKWTTYANTKNTSIKISGLITCGAYIFKIQPKNSKGEVGSYSNEVYQVTRAKKISDFKVSATSNNSVTLTWKAEPRVTGYRIYKYNNSSKTFKYYKTVKAGTTSFTDTNLNSATTYRYEIIGYRDYRNKMYFGYGSDSVSAKTSSFASPSLKISGFTNKTVSLKWNKVSGAKGYNVQVFRSGKWTNYDTTTSNSIKVSGLITCGAYIFRVQVKQANGSYTTSGPYSNQVYQVTRANKISSFKVSKVSKNAVELKWTAEPRVTGYRIYKYNNATKTYNYYKTVKAGTTSFTDTGINSGTTCKYEIIGYRDYRDKMYFGYSSDSISAKTI